MKKIEVFGPAICCPRCVKVKRGSEAGAVLRQSGEVESLGVEVERCNLARQPDKFTRCKPVTVKEFIDFLLSDDGRQVVKFP